MYEDSHGRIWLFSIANTIGYIYNKKYTRLTKEKNIINDVIYPYNIIEVGDKTLITQSFNRIDTIVDLTLLKNNVLKLINVFPRNFGIRTRVYITNKYIIEVSSDKIYIHDAKELVKKDRIFLNSIKQTTYHTPINVLSKLTGYQTRTFRDKYILRFRHNNDKVSLYQIHPFSEINLTLPKGEYIAHLYPLDKNLIIISNKNVYQYDSNLTLTEKYDISSFAGEKIYYHSDINWGRLLCTTDTGLYIISDKESLFKSQDNHLDNSVFINNKNDSIGYWWDNDKKILSEVYKGNAIYQNHLPNISNINRIITLTDTDKLILNRYRVHLYTQKHITIDLVKNMNILIVDDRLEFKNEFTENIFLSINDACKINDKLYMLGTGSIGFVEAEIPMSSDTVRIKNISRERFSSISHYDNYVIAYNKDKLIYYNIDTRKKIVLNHKLLYDLGLYPIQKILHDERGNIYIKTYDKLYFYNPSTNRLKSLFNTYVLVDTKIRLFGNEIHIAGGFGIIKALVNDNGNLSGMKTFLNTKNIYYTHLKDVQFSTDHAYLKTNKGGYIVTYSNKFVDNNDDYTLTYQTDKVLDNITQGDTIKLESSDNLITLDVIRPSGVGNLNIKYAIEKGSPYFKSYDISLNDMSPDKYYEIVVIANDDAWKSKPIEFTLYIEPKWWQTTTAKRIIFAAAILLLGILFYITTIITRRIVNRNNEKKNNQRDLELKSIYSQINPHFIFNSLSTAQYFVRKNLNKEAYEHINQFSDLLRSYIKSSRNKYITITEEKENLINYLELQLKRFEDKFHYSIEIDSSVDPNKIKIPSLLIQPLVENALNHGIFHKEGTGHVSIFFRLISKDTLQCIIDDDGIGRERSKKLRTDRTRKADSYGTILIKELIDTFNKYEKINIEIQYIDKDVPETGTTVIVNIKHYDNV